VTDMVVPPGAAQNDAADVAVLPVSPVWAVNAAVLPCCARATVLTVARPSAATTPPARASEPFRRGLVTGPPSAR
jgi:hypothetical protein